MSLNYINLRAKQLVIETHIMENYIFSLHSDFTKWVEMTWNSIITNEMKVDKLHSTVNKYNKTFIPIDKTIISIENKTEIISNKTTVLQNEMKQLRSEIDSFISFNSTINIYQYMFYYLGMIFGMFLFILLWLCVLNHYYF